MAEDGSFVVTASDDKTARIWELDTGACAGVLPHIAPLTVSVSWDVRFPAHALIWHLPLSLMNAGCCCQGLILSSDGQLLLTVTANHIASLWDVGTATCLCTLEGHKDSITGAAFDGGGFHVATCSKDSTLRYWSTISGAIHPCAYPICRCIVSLALIYHGMVEWVCSSSCLPGGGHAAQSHTNLC